LSDDHQPHPDNLLDPTPALPATETAKAADWPPFELSMVSPEFRVPRIPQLTWSDPRSSIMHLTYVFKQAVFPIN